MPHAGHAGLDVDNTHDIGRIDASVGVGGGGDLGFVDENSQLDPAFSKAVQAVAKDTPTEVIEGADGTYRIGRVTEIVKE